MWRCRLKIHINGDTVKRRDNRHESTLPFYQHLPVAALTDLIVLVEDFHLEVDQAAAETGHGLGVFDGDANANGVADEDRALHLPVEAAKGEDRLLHKAHADGETAGDAEDEQPVSDALAEGVLSTVFSVGVYLVPITGECGEVDDIGFGDGAGGADNLVADLKFLKEETQGAGKLAFGHVHGRVVMRRNKGGLGELIGGIIP